MKLEFSPFMRAFAATGFLAAGQAHAVKYYVTTPVGPNDFPLWDAGANIDGIPGADIDIEVWLSGSSSQDEMLTRVGNRISDAGFSDVEPALYTEVTQGQKDKLEVHSTAALVFGTPVSTNLRNALQVAQTTPNGPLAAVAKPKLVCRA